MRTLVAIPVFNEQDHLAEVLREALTYPADILVIDDGSTDATPHVVRQFPDVMAHRNAKNRGYGAALRHAFEFSIDHGYDVVITMDGDRQHQPWLIPQFMDEIESADIVSGSRYLRPFEMDTDAPAGRRRINSLVTDELNACLNLGITDSFCGFKAYRTDAVARMHLTEDGYGMPLELWVEAACKKLIVRELAVPRVYVDLNRSFGVALDDGDSRLAYYQLVIDRALERARERHGCQMTVARMPKFGKVDV